jgi:hypothetical protein
MAQQKQPRHGSSRRARPSIGLTVDGKSGKPPWEEMVMVMLEAERVYRTVVQT